MRPFLPYVLALFLQTLPGAEPTATNPIPLTSSAHGPPAGAAAGPEFAALQRQIEAILTRTHTPGAGIAIVRRDGPAWIAGIGMSDTATGRPATPDTLFRVGSISKVFASLALLQLQQDGRLDLQDPLHSRAPDLEFWNPWESTDPVRLVHLLEHTAGWDDYSFAEFAYRGTADGPLREGLAFHPRARTSRWQPGTRYAYSSAGTAAAAYVVEQVAGQRYEDYVSEHWFRPLGMTTASFLWFPAVESRLTRLYQPDGQTPIPYWHMAERPAGALNASVRELANLIQFFLNRGSFDGTRLLAAAAIDRLEHATSNYGAREGLPTGYGLGNYTTTRDGWVYHGHDGSVPGGLATLAYLPDAGVGFVFALNAKNFAASAEIHRLLCDYVTHSLPAPPKTPVIALSATVARDYLGWYEPVGMRFAFTEGWAHLFGLARLSSRGTSLTWQPLLGREDSFDPVSTRLFRRDADQQPTLALIADDREGTLLQFSELPNGSATAGQTYRRVGICTLAAEALTCALTPLLTITSLLFALVWLPLKLAGRLSHAKHLSIRTLPLLAAVCLLGPVVFVFFKTGGDFNQLVTRLAPSSAKFVATILIIGGLAAAGLVAALRFRRAEIHGFVWWHSFLTSLVLTVVVGYFGYWSAIVWRF